MRLSGPQPRQVIGELRIAAARPAQLFPGPRVELLVDRVIGLALDGLAGGEAQCFCSRTPPPARRFPGLGGVDVVAAGGLLGAGLALVLPHVAEVVALGDGDDHGQSAASLRDRAAAELTMIIQMNATVCAAIGSW